MTPKVAMPSDNSSKELSSMDAVAVGEDVTSVCVENLKNGLDENSNTDIVLPSKISTPKNFRRMFT